MALLELLEHLRSPFLTTLNMVFTVMGGGTFFVAILCLIFWCVDKKFAYRLGFIFIASGLAVQTLKIVLRIERPFIKNPDLKPVEAAKAGASGYSFPSGHTQASTSLFLTLSLNSKKTILRFLYFIPIILVIFSRMYLGVHTPYDVFVSFIISALITMFIDYLFDNFSLHKKHKKWIIFLISSIICILSFYTFYLYYYNPDVKIENLEDIMSVMGLTVGFLIGWLIETEKINFNEKATTIPFQILKYILGMILVVSVKIISKKLISLIPFLINPLLGIFIEYLILSFFIVGIYPIIIKNIFTNEEMAYRHN